MYINKTMVGFFLVGMIGISGCALAAVCQQNPMVGYSKSSNPILLCSSGTYTITDIPGGPGRHTFPLWATGTSVNIAIQGGANSGFTVVHPKTAMGLGPNPSCTASVCGFFYNVGSGVSSFDLTITNNSGSAVSLRTSG